MYLYNTVQNDVESKSVVSFVECTILNQFKKLGNTTKKKSKYFISYHFNYSTCYLR